MQTILKDLLLLALIVFTCIQFININKMRIHIRKLEKIKEALYEIAYTIVHTENEEELYDIILSTAIQLIPNASKGSILLLSEDNKFYFKTLIGYSETLKNISFSKEEIYISNMTSKMSIIIKNPSKFDENFLSVDKNEYLMANNALDIECTISSPIYIDNKLIGLINIDSTSKNKIFTEEDRTFMDYIKRDLELVLKNTYIQNKLKFMANYDELTGLINRRYFRRLLEREVKMIKECDDTLSVVAIDINDFKIINDTYGHCMGDRALKRFAKVISSGVGDNICARISGDEFVIVFKNYLFEEANEKVIRIKEEINKIKFGDLSLDFSYGIYCVNSKENIKLDEILIRADREMYKDKKKFHCNI
ncbi:sensor domain-containing diguanylate cyclase [uncultured Clostridium sp.]|uniref:sensor domain-containing diguanylate cyclase n=1 Tax=uncultured Clostridium sp. TaxID=59620 RepID=UPI0028E2744D|nr:sensor domain-containing diguanylate cyclase [uncultured Clostridium sp.]